MTSDETGVSQVFLMADAQRYSTVNALCLDHVSCLMENSLMDVVTYFSPCYLIPLE